VSVREGTCTLVSLPPLCMTPNLLFLPLHSLTFNDIGVRGAAAIGEVLKHNRTITKLE
jgi:hypothetical protein